MVSPRPFFGIADRIEATTPIGLAALNAQEIRLVMLTGDNRTTAEAVARKLGIDAVEAAAACGRPCRRVGYTVTAQIVNAAKIAVARAILEAARGADALPRSPPRSSD